VTYLNKPLRFLYPVIFLIAAAIGTTMLMSPVYAEKLGADYMSLGIMGALYAGGYTVMTIVTGLLMDRYEKIRLYALFAALNIVAVGAFAFTNSIDQIVILRGLLGLVTGTFWVSSSSIATSLSEPTDLTRNIGLYNLSWIAGFAVGPLAGGFIGEYLGFRTLFLIQSLTVAAGLFIILTKLMPYANLHGTMGRITIDFNALRDVSAAYYCIFPYALSNGIYFSILPGYMGDLGITASIIGILLTISSITKAAGFFGVERLVNWGTKRAIRLISVLLAVSLACIAWVSEAWILAIPLAVYGLANGLLEPIILNYIAQRSPPESRSFQMGIYETVFGLGMIVGPMATGFITQSYPPNIIYLLLAAASLGIIPLSLWLKQG
jgi:MFS family permease